MALAPVKRRIGDDWSFVVGPFTNPDGSALDLTGFAFGANLSANAVTAPLALTGALTAGVVTYAVPAAATAGFAPDPPGAMAFPTVLEVFWTDAAGKRLTLFVLPVNVQGPRDIT